MHTFATMCVYLIALMPFVFCLSSSGLPVDVSSSKHVQKVIDDRVPAVDAIIREETHPWVATTHSLFPVHGAAGGRGDGGDLLASSLGRRLLQTAETLVRSRDRDDDDDDDDHGDDKDHDSGGVSGDVSGDVSGSVSGNCSYEWNEAALHWELDCDGNKDDDDVVRPQACARSSLGYGCAMRLEHATLHYRLSPSPTPPDNACTRGASVAGPVPGAQAYVHWAFEGDLSGYASLGFTQHPGHMVPADVVLGAIGSDGRGSVGAYMLTDYDSLPPPLPQQYWAASMGVMRTSGRTLICFTSAARGVELAQPTTGRRTLAQAGPSLIDLSEGVNLIWAVNTRVSGEHKYDGALTLDVLRGQVKESGSESTRTLVIVHGALMVAAFVLLMPTGVLMARHRRLVVGKEVLGQGVWYVAHFVTQVVAAVCFIAGVVIAFVKLSSTPKGAPEAALDAHNLLGIIACVLVGLQVLVSVFARPAPCSARRPLWARVHRYAAWVVIIVGMANCGLGIALWAENGWGEGADWLAWAVPCAVVLVVLVVADRVLVRVNRNKRISHDGLPPSPSAVSPAPTPFGPRSENGMLETHTLENCTGGASVPLMMESINDGGAKAHSSGSDGPKGGEVQLGVVVGHPVLLQVPHPSEGAAAPSTSAAASVVTLTHAGSSGYYPMVPTLTSYPATEPTSATAPLPHVAINPR